MGKSNGEEVVVYLYVEKGRVHSVHETKESAAETRWRSLAYRGKEVVAITKHDLGHMMAIASDYAPVSANPGPNARVLKHGRDF